MLKNNSRRTLTSILVLMSLALTFGARPALQTFSAARAQELSASPTPTVSTPVSDKAELHQALVDLTNLWTVMCVAAHPDDEDGTTLTVLRRKYGANTISLFSTYGEGGQNAVGPELYEELGVIRAQETIRASQIQGSQPYFLGLKDFGYSKSADEAFRVWGHDEALRRMVLKIRELRPDVIITNHDTTSGHGHHQATGQLILEAFDAAADPKRFPEQLNQLKPWQVQRLFVRIFGGGTGQKPDGQGGPEKIVAVDPNEVDPVRGASFAEQALKALQQHATQGPWPKSIEEWLRARRVEGGKLPLVRYRIVREAPGAEPLTGNSANLLSGLKTPESLQSRLTSLTIESRPLTEFLEQPNRVLDALINWRAKKSGAEPSMEDPRRLRLWEARFNKAMSVASGVSLTLDLHAMVLVPGIKTSFSLNLGNASDRVVHIKELRVDAWGANTRLETAEQLLPDTETTVAVEKTTPKDATFTVPKEDHLYDGLFLGKHFLAGAELEIDGARFSLSATTIRDVAPAVEIKSMSPSIFVKTPKTLLDLFSISTVLTNHLSSPFHGSLTHEVISGGHTRGAAHEILLNPNETRLVEVVDTDSIPDRGRIRWKSRSGVVVLSVRDDNVVDARDFYGPKHELPITQRTSRIIYADARVRSGLRVGYLPSFDETLKKSLAALGVNAQELNASNIEKTDLSAYQTIIIDNRGYEAHPELIAANSRLLDYVKSGGTLIVFYHKSNEWNPDPKKNRSQLAPYPLVLGEERVTDETAPIKFLLRRHPMLNFPNRIRPADFRDWIQERGLYYPKEWDSHYSALFSTNDPGEPPLRGGLLVARFGKGNYVYTSMVWYRQLRAGVPGAYRVFANMISYGRK